MRIDGQDNDIKDSQPTNSNNYLESVKQVSNRKEWWSFAVQDLANECTHDGPWNNNIQVCRDS